MTIACRGLLVKVKCQTNAVCPTVIDSSLLLVLAGASALCTFYGVSVLIFLHNVVYLLLFFLDIL